MTLDATQLRGAFSRFLTGVTVVTTRDAEGMPVGFTANSFTSVSLDPPMLLVCPGKHLSSFDVFCDPAQFGVSILAEGQEAVANTFASSTLDRFAQCQWDTPEGDTPLITGRAAGFVCDSAQIIEAGDHVVLMGNVVHFDDAGLPGLGYGPDGYFSQSKEREAEAPHRVKVQASVLLEDGPDLLLTADEALPTVMVAKGESPLRALTAGLIDMGIGAQLSVVYAVYEEGPAARRIVFRGRATGPREGLRNIAIAELETASIRDKALQSLLRRFAQEHRTQSFGLYVGDEYSGDVLPSVER